MTIWSSLADHPGPKYLAIADAIERAIAGDELHPNSRLPAQRDLARELGVTVGTVGRGYAEATRRGLLSGEVGRGTFVRPSRGESPGFGLAHGEEGGVLNLAHNAPHFGENVAQVLRRAMARWPADGQLVASLGYQDHTGLERHRRVGAEWLTRQGVPAHPDRMVITSGAQHAMFIAFAALAEPGDVVLAEALEYPGMNAVARFLHLRLEGVAMDSHGIRPDALERACREHAPAALYCTPTIQNPTATVMPEERRREITAIARRHGVVIVEDDTYGFLVDEAPPPLATLADDSSLYITSLSKCLAPGLRIGYLLAPQHAMEELSNAMMTTTIMASTMAAELTTHLIENGVADEVLEIRRDESLARGALAREILGTQHLHDGVRAESSHLWLALPEPWRAEEFTAQARSRGIAVAPAELFAVGRTPAPHAVRLSLGAVADEGALHRGLDTLADLLASPPTPGFAGV